MQDGTVPQEPRRGLLVAWTAICERNATLVLVAVGMLMALSVWAATTLRIDTDSSRMLDPALPFQARAQALNAAFPAIKNTIAVVVRAEGSDAADAAVGALTAGIAGKPGVAEVFAPSADPFFERNGLLYLSKEDLDDRLTRLSKSANMLAALRADQTLDGFVAALSEAGRLAERADLGPEALDAFYREAAATIAAAADGEAGHAFGWSAALGGGGGRVTRVISVLPALDFAALNPAKAAMQAVTAAVDGLDPAVAAGVEIGITGDPVLRAEELRSVAGRIGLSLGLSMLLVATVLWLALGTVSRAGLALGALIATLVMTTGFAAVAIGALNLVSIAFIVLMTGLGIDFAIHVMAHLDEDARETTPEQALMRTATALGPALILSAATTSVAFLAFALTDFVGMAQLGLIGGVGVMLAFGVAVTVIPAAVALRPRLALGAPILDLPSVGSSGLAARAVPLIAAAVGLVAIVIATGARFDADPMGLRNPDARSVAVYNWLAADPDTAPLRLGLMTDDAQVAGAEAERLADLPEVRRAVWLGDLIPKDQDDKLALIDLAWPSLDFAVNGTPVDLTTEAPPDMAGLGADLGDTGAGAELAAAIAAYAEVRGPERDAALREALFRYFPALVDRLAAQLEVDRVGENDLPATLRGRFLSPEGMYRVEISPEADVSRPAERAAFVAAVAAAAPEAGGPPAQIEGAATTIAGAMASASLIALGAAALLAWLTLRSVLVVGAILVPVILAGAVTMAASVLLGMPFNYANIIVLPLLIGIGVDSGIHLAMRTRRAGQVFDTSTPRAVFYSALTTVGAFATLGLSEHRGTASMGIMLAIALIAAVIMAFALTPALVRMATSRSDAPPPDTPLTPGAS